MGRGLGLPRVRGLHDDITSQSCLLYRCSCCPLDVLAHGAPGGENQAPWTPQAVPRLSVQGSGALGTVGAQLGAQGCLVPGTTPFPVPPVTSRMDRQRVAGPVTSAIGKGPGHVDPASPQCPALPLGHYLGHLCLAPAAHCPCMAPRALPGSSVPGPCFPLTLHGPWGLPGSSGPAPDHSCPRTGCQLAAAALSAFCRVSDPWALVQGREGRGPRPAAAEVSEVRAPQWAQSCTEAPARGSLGKQMHVAPPAGQRWRLLSPCAAGSGEDLVLWDPVNSGHLCWTGLLVPASPHLPSPPVPTPVFVRRQEGERNK